MKASEKIDQQIAELDDWRGETLARLREIIGDTAPELQEAWKWGSPTWVGKGNVLSLGAFKKHVKFTFFKGAELDDARGVFNAGEEAKDMRSIDFREGDAVDEEALRELIRAAVALDGGG